MHAACQHDHQEAGPGRALVLCVLCLGRACAIPFVVALSVLAPHQVHSPRRPRCKLQVQQVVAHGSVVCVLHGGCARCTRGKPTPSQALVLRVRCSWTTLLTMMCSVLSRLSQKTRTCARRRRSRRPRSRRGQGRSAAVDVHLVPARSPRHRPCLLAWLSCSLLL